MGRSWFPKGSKKDGLPHLHCWESVQGNLGKAVDFQTFIRRFLANSDGSPFRAKAWLAAAGAYNLVWGAVTILFPHVLFDWTGATRPSYPEIWQCVGMIVGVYGVGYLIAATKPRVHWPIVLVGLLGKVFGPIGFAKALYDGVFPPLFGVTILTNDLLWWVPFSMILLDAFQYHLRQAGTRSP